MPYKKEKYIFKNKRFRKKLGTKHFVWQKSSKYILRSTRESQSHRFEMIEWMNGDRISILDELPL